MDALESRDRGNRSTESLLQQDRYTPEELADLLEMDITRIHDAAFDGRLEAEIVEHDIISISRSAAIRWLDSGR